MKRERVEFTPRQWADIVALLVVVLAQVAVFLVFGKHTWVFLVMIVLSLAVFAVLVRIWLWLVPLARSREH